MAQTTKAASGKLTGALTGKPEHLYDLLAMKLQMLLDVEQQIIKALPDMIDNATDQKLRNALESHLKETEGQAERMEKAMQHIGMDADAKTDAIMKAILGEGTKEVQMARTDEVRDATIIAASQTVEMYEIGAYGTALAWAKEMGHKEVVELLEETLEEEKACNEKLTELAEGGINEKAAMAMTEE